MQGKRFSGEERRKQIMEASLNLFAAKGFNGTRTKDIAERIGTSETLIFQHFSTKEELYYAVLKEFFAGHPIQPDIEDEIACRDDWGFFYNFAKHLLIHMSKDPRIIRLAIYRTLEGSPPGRIAQQPEG
jgi:TetR/AcrR family transcriptional regulator